MQNTQFTSTSSNIELMLEAFFCVQLAEHVKAWRWHMYTSKHNQLAVDAALRQACRELCNAMQSNADTRE